MAIRMTGLVSGLDTESIVAALMSAQRTKQTKVENQKTKLEWKQTIWSSLNTKLYDFYKGQASSMRLQGAYQTKKATSSDNSKVTATCKSTATNGTYQVKVNQLASAQYVTSGKLGQVSDGNGGNTAVTSSTTLAALGFDTQGGTTQIQITTKDKSVSLYVESGTTVGDFVTALNDAGLNASFDEGQGRFFIGASASGVDSQFTITTNILNGDQLKAREELQSLLNYDGLSATYRKNFNAALDTLQNGESDKKAEEALSSLMEISDANVKSDAKEFYTADLTAKYQAEYFDADGNVTEAGKKAFEEAGNEIKDAWTDEDWNTAVTSWMEKKVATEVESSEYTKKIEEAVTTGYVEGSDGSRVEIAKPKTERETELSDAISNYVEQIEKGVSASAKSALNVLGMEDVTGAAMSEADSATGMVVIAASDTVVEINGATLTSSNTTLDVNGLTLNLTGTTGGETVTLTVTNDTAAVYDTIKEFLTQYNSILTEMNTYYNASSSRGYDVLTDEQKEAMTEDEIEKWEDKIKDSLLRRDTTLGSIISTFRSTMMGSVVASDGKTYTLANLGITTSTDYTERGILHIKGDEDDEEYADETNKLEELLNTNPELVQEVLSKLVGNLYSAMYDKMSKTTLSSALTFYNDIEMKNQITQYEKDISEWEEKLNDLEDRYYSQFTAMEKALANLQSQQSYISSLMG